MRRLLLLLAPLAIACATPALAWEETGHRIVGLVGAEAFPPGLPAFLRTPESIRMIGELAREADRLKGAGQPMDTDHSPDHFVDVTDTGRIEADGGPALAELPGNLAAYQRAMGSAGSDIWKGGLLPYSIIEGWEQLTKDFAYWRVDSFGEKKGKTAEERAWFVKDRQLRETLILRDLGYWSHFVGDGSQPLHVTVHFNGWGKFPNPNNYTQEKIHSPFEGAFVHENATAAAVKAALPPYQACGCTIQQATIGYLTATSAKVEPLYQLWAQGGFKDHDPRGTAFVVERLAAGAAALRDMVTDAWNASENAVVGYPNTPVKTIEQSGDPHYGDIYGHE